MDLWSAKDNHPPGMEEAMICITCGGRFHKRPFQYYFCSKICWEDASRNIPRSILSDDVEPLNYTLKLTASSRLFAAFAETNDRRETHISGP